MRLRFEVNCAAAAAHPSRPAPDGRRVRRAQPASAVQQVRHGPGRASRRGLLRVLLRPQRHLQSARDRRRGRPSTARPAALLVGGRPLDRGPRRRHSARHRDAGVVAGARVGALDRHQRVAARALRQEAVPDGAADVARIDVQADRHGPGRRWVPARRPQRPGPRRAGELGHVHLPERRHDADHPAGVRVPRRRGVGGARDRLSAQRRI